MTGAIVINGYYFNFSMKNQVERLTEEFNKRGVEIDVLRSNTLFVTCPGAECFTYENGKKAPLKKYAFIVYLNKDRYQAEMLEKAGYKLFNSSKAIVDCDDKMLTDICLAGSVAVPKTVSSPIMYSKSEDENFLDYVENELKYPIIVKNVYGSMGKEVYKADNRTELLGLFNKLKSYPHLYQEAIMPLGQDIRVMVIGGEIVSSMIRKSETDFRSNAALGGTCTKCVLTEDQKTLVKKAVNVLKLDYAGVDVLSGYDKNYICEVNSNAFFYKSEEVTGVNIAGIYADHILKNI